MRAHPRRFACHGLFRRGELDGKAVLASVTGALFLISGCGSDTSAGGAPSGGGVGPTPKQVFLAFDKAIKDADCQELLAVATEKYVRGAYPSCPDSNDDLVDEYAGADLSQWKMSVTGVEIHGRSAHVAWLETGPDGRTPGGVTMVKTPAGWKVNED